jgi:hypothetical protein
MICNTSSFAFDFHTQLDFRLNVLFRSVLHHYGVETSLFSLVLHECPLTKEISMKSNLDTSTSMTDSMLLPRVLAHGTFALAKKTCTQIRAIEVLALDSF